mgnify:CR=1 FL=1
MYMTANQLFGFGALIGSWLVVLVGLPLQIYKNYKNKSCAGISLPLICIFFYNYICWTSYAWTKPDHVLALAQTPGVVMVVILLAQGLYYGTTSKCPTCGK